MDRFPKAVGLSTDPVDHHPVRYAAASKGFPPDHDAQVSRAIRDGPPPDTVRT